MVAAAGEASTRNTTPAIAVSVPATLAITTSTPSRSLVASAGRCLQLCDAELDFLGEAHCPLMQILMALGNALRSGPPTLQMSERAHCLRCHVADGDATVTAIHECSLSEHVGGEPRSVIRAVRVVL